IGMVTLIMFTTTSSLSVASASHGGGGGAGAGVRGGGGTRIRMDTTVTAIPTGMDTAVAMVKVATANMAMANVAMVKVAMVNMAMPASPELPNYNADCNAPVITMDPLMESWGRKRGPQSGRTNGTTAT